MKLVCAVAAASLLALPASSQTIYSVPANSKGNHLTLTVANESLSTAAQNVEVRVVKQGMATSFAQKSLMVKLVDPGKESDVTFSFDVSREARTNAKDTLEFLVTDKQGSTWKKSIFVQYTGPTEYRLDQNFPNPFNPTTKIYYQLPVASKVTIKVYDILGREVKSLVDGQQEAGYQETRFSASSLASGVYFCRMVAEPLSGKGSFTSVKKMMAMK